MSRVREIGQCELAIISLADFIRILEKLPDDVQIKCLDAMQEYVEARYEKINKEPSP